MKKEFIISFALLGIFYFTNWGQQQTSNNLVIKNDKTVIKDNNSENDPNIEKGIIVYLSYNGTATDDGNITGKNTQEEYLLFMKNNTENIVYVISRVNYGLWSAKKIMPAELKPMVQTYKVDIGSSKKLENADNTVEYYEITKLNSMVETDEIE